MLTFIHHANQIFGGILHVFCLPMRYLDPIVSLTVISAVAGLVMVWVYGKVSDQSAIKSVRTCIDANFLAIRLFNENLVTIFRSLGSILRHTLVYMQYSIRPILILSLPVACVIVQLNHRYDARPLRVGEKAIVKLTFADPSPLVGPQPTTLGSDPAYTVDTLGIKIPEKKEIAWRIEARQAGIHSLQVTCNGETLTKQLSIGDNNEQLASRRRTGKNVFEYFLYPCEPPLPSSAGVESIEITYPDRNLDIAGWRCHWLLQFLIVSIVVGYAFKGVLGVEL